MRTRTPRPLTLAALVVAAGLSLAACASSTSSSTGSAGGSSGPTTTASGTGALGATSDCPQATASTQATVPAAGEPTVTVPSGPPPAHLVTHDLQVGSGAVAQAGDSVTVKYVGVSWTCKFIFDASWTDHATPTGTFTFTLGAGQVIPGWDHGIVGMKVGGRRELIIPPSLAYGPNGQPPTIVPNDTLIFVVDLVSVQPPAATTTTTAGG